MCSCVLECMLACHGGARSEHMWLMSATCVPWYVPHGNPDCQNTATRRVSTILPPEPEPGPC